MLAFAPSAWPNPVVEDGAVVEERVVPELSSAARAVDAACRRGDEARFAELTTSAYREELQGRLQAVDAELDAETMRKMADSGGAYSDWLRRPLLATHALSADVAIAVDRGQGFDGEHDGAQVLVFTWDGEQFLLDEVRHAPRVHTAAAGKRFLVELLRLR